ncbi:D-hexose-6-phosphate mutarotase [Pseudomonas sp. Marseille-Q5117]|uniref:D-hexose-6-phosphate mutarotase n=1 Tax=Pseudomonas sp. Marseille-Q5117 TaxID=2972777 RepID=UPI0021C603A0|nr:D-hexose-6-phosphate mutarotase [Pseudomonas sp. Marseille-Q5117]
MSIAATIHPYPLYDLGAWCIEYGEAYALICTQGAQLLEYGFRNEPPVIWNNAHASFIAGTPIRGGVPVCWPWFADLQNNPEAVKGDWQMADAPFHGLVRQALWQVEHMEADEHEARLTFASPVTLHGLTARIHLKLDENSLELDLDISNHGPRAVTMTAALHSYYAVSDVREVTLQGFAGACYYDNLNDRTLCQQVSEPRISGPTEQVYQGLGERIVIEDPAWQRRIFINTRSSRSAVLWNPGPERAATLDQFHPDAWRAMLCIETTRVLEDMFTIGPGASGGLGVRISRQLVQR